MDNKKIVNLTPHSLIIYGENGVKKEEIPSSGVVRVKEENTKIGEINGIPIYKKQYTESEGLPNPQDNTYFFVSVIVAQANPHRSDLILSSDLVRDEQGRILGCSSFATINSMSFQQRLMELIEKIQKQQELEEYTKIDEMR